MKYSPSPLRYPGGKASIYKMVSDILTNNRNGSISYAEPYAGGCGLALSLLFKGDVQELHLNDIDISIASLWHCILNDTDRLLKKVNDVNVNMEEWKKQKLVQDSKETVDTLELAFSTLFLNRTNHSGIIKGGVMGGKNQTGKYKLDCRFTKQTLIDRIKQIADNADKIYFYNMDAIDFISHMESLLINDLMLMVDPPYYMKGKSLYTNFYDHSDHVYISEKLNNTSIPWLLTYDNVVEIKQIYEGFNQYQFNINYSVANKRKGTELLITSDYFKNLNHERLIKA